MSLITAQAWFAVKSCFLSSLVCCHAFEQALEFWLVFGTAVFKCAFTWFALDSVLCIGLRLGILCGCIIDQVWFALAFTVKSCFGLSFIFWSLLQLNLVFVSALAVVWASSVVASAMDLFFEH
ncbi:hypothetical protein U1Q18_037284 [Sarracenia purpurea var. burkii]